MFLDVLSCFSDNASLLGDEFFAGDIVDFSFFERVEDTGDGASDCIDLPDIVIYSFSSEVVVFVLDLLHDFVDSFELTLQNDGNGSADLSDLSIE